MELYPIDIAIHVVNIIILYVILRALLWKPVKAFMAGSGGAHQGSDGSGRQASAGGRAEQDGI